MTYLLIASWLVGAYALGWYRGRQGWPFLWRKAAPVSRETPSVKHDPKPVVLPADEPTKMAERLAELVPGFNQMAPDVKERVLSRMKQKAESQLGLLTRP